MRVIILAISILTVTAACEGGSPGDASSPAAPVDEKAVQAVEEREAVLKLMKRNFGPLAGMAKEKIPYDAGLAQKNATHLANLVVMMEDVFATDTRGSGVETEALDKIWEQPDKFAGKIDALVEAADELAAVAGDESALADAVGKVGKSCGSCHDDFREDDD